MKMVRIPFAIGFWNLAALPKGSEFQLLSSAPDNTVNSLLYPDIFRLKWFSNVNFNDSPARSFEQTWQVKQERW